jgi:hypothetical protein
MSYASLLKHRCSLLELHEVLVGQLAGADWVSVIDDLPCFLDLRPLVSKDQMWTNESARPSLAQGVLFLHVHANGIAKSGMRVKITRGPGEFFQITGAVEEAWTPRRLHHIECGVEEVGNPLAKGSVA